MCVSLSLSLFVCVCPCAVVYAPHECGGHRTTWRSCLSPSAMNTRDPILVNGLHSKRFNLLSYFIIPDILRFFLKNLLNCIQVSVKPFTVGFFFFWDSSFLSAAPSLLSVLHLWDHLVSRNFRLSYNPMGLLLQLQFVIDRHTALQRAIFLCIVSSTSIQWTEKWIAFSIIPHLLNRLEEWAEK